MESSSTTTTTTTTTNTTTATNSSNSSSQNVLSDEEVICSLAEKGENLLQFLLITIHSITKHLQSLQWDPIFLHSIISSPPAGINTTINNAISNTNISESVNGTNQGVDDQQLVMNLDTSIFHKDNERMKLLNSQCVEYIEKLQQIIVEIVNTESRIEESASKTAESQKEQQQNDQEMDDISSLTTTISTTSLSSIESKEKELEELKLIAYKKNCIIKKLIDNMRLLQLSINTLNRTSLDQ